MFMVLDLQVAFTCGAKSVDEAGASSEDAWKDGKKHMELNHLQLS